MIVGSSPAAVTSTSDTTPVSSKEFLDIQATIECGFTLKRVRGMHEHAVSECAIYVHRLNNQTDPHCRSAEYEILLTNIYLFKIEIVLLSLLFRTKKSVFRSHIYNIRL